MRVGRKKAFKYVKRMLPTFRAVVMFCSTNRLFTYFRWKYLKKQIGDLNDIVKLRGKIRTTKFSILFYKLCVGSRVSPKFNSTPISRSRTRHSPSSTRAFINDEIDRINMHVRCTKCAYKCQWVKIRNFVCHFLTYFDFAATFRKLISGLKMLLKKSTTGTFNIQLLFQKPFGGMLSDKERHILNLSDYSLSDMEKLVLSNGLDFCLPPESINKEEVFAEF